MNLQELNGYKNQIELTRTQTDYRLQQDLIANNYQIMAEIENTVDSLSVENREFLISRLVSRYGYQNQQLDDMKEFVKLVSLVANRLGLAYNKHLLTDIKKMTMKESFDDDNFDDEIETDDLSDYQDFLYIRQYRFNGGSYAKILQDLWGVSSNWAKINRPNSHKSRQLRIADKYLSDWVKFLKDNGFNSIEDITLNIFGSSNPERIKRVENVFKTLG